MTTFYIYGENELQEWMLRNKAEYTGDFIEGCLLNNFVVSTPRGYAAIYEHYVNEWTSCYYVEFETGVASAVWDNWYRFETTSVNEVV